MATAKERHSVTESYLEEIKSKMGMCPMLEENDMKMLHINAPLGDWREWKILTYNHNVMADWLVRENEELQKIKDDLEMKIKMVSTPVAFPPFPASLGYPNLSRWPNPLLVNPGLQTKSQPVEEKEKPGEH